MTNLRSEDEYFKGTQYSQCFFDVVIFLKQVSKHHLMGAESVYIHVYDRFPYMGSVAERSKALVLGTSLFGGVGSNPTAATGFGTANQRSMTGP